MTNIPIERLKSGNDITVQDAAWGAMSYLVVASEFDGSGYLVTYGLERALHDDTAWSDTLHVDAGGTVEADGVLRTDAEITPEEWEAKAEAGPVNLLAATRAAGLRPDLNTVADLLCAAVSASTSLDSVREGSEHLQAAE